MGNIFCRQSKEPSTEPLDEDEEEVTIAVPPPRIHAPPVAFPHPRLHRNLRGRIGRWDHVLVRAENPTVAYWPLPSKEQKRMRTILGHAEICAVLERVGDEFQITNRLVIVKVSYWRAMNANLGEDAIREISALQLLGDNPRHVVGLEDALYDDQAVNMVMPYCPGGDLLTLVMKRTRPLSEQAAKHWLGQILLGVQYLHGRGICHCDLSPENVVIDGDVAFIIDLGLCLRIPYESGNGTVVPMEEAPQGSRGCWIQGHSRRGKRSYMPPEMYLSRSNFDGHAVDVWTCATTLVFMLTRECPYKYPGGNRFRKLTQDLPTYFKEENVALSQSCMDLLKGMLAIDPLSRFSLEQVMNHPWWTEST